LHFPANDFRDLNDFIPLEIGDMQGLVPGDGWVFKGKFVEALTAVVRVQELAFLQSAGNHTDPAITPRLLDEIGDDVKLFGVIFHAIDVPKLYDQAIQGTGVMFADGLERAVR